MNIPLTIRHILRDKFEFPASATVVKECASGANLAASWDCWNVWTFLDEEIAVEKGRVDEVRDVFGGGHPGAEVEVEVRASVRFSAGSAQTAAKEPE
jgi:hypothetical protein